MTRFDDNFDTDLGVIAEQITPSPTAWEEIQQRIANREPHTETEIIMLTDNTLTRRRWPLAAAAAAVVALTVGGIALVNRGDDAEQPAEPVPTIAPAPGPTTPSVPDSATSDSAEPTTFPAEGAMLSPGTYTTQTVGVPLTFAVPAEAEWTVAIHNLAGFVFGTDEAFVAVTRLGSFYDADEAVDEATRGLGSLPPDDIDQWFEVNDIPVLRSGEGTIGGRDAQFRQARLPDDVDGPCPALAAPCIHMASNSADLIAAYDLPIDIGSVLPHSFWVVEMGEYEPLGIWMFSNVPEQHEAWLDQVAPMIDSIEFGEPAPAVPDGTARVPLRATATSAMTGVRSVGAETSDGAIPVQSTSTLDGDLTGELVSSGTQSGSGIVEESIFTGAIDGVGEGTLTLETTTTLGAIGDITIESVVVSGTGDFEGLVGSATTSITDGDATGPFTGTFDLTLTVPRTG